MLIQRIYKYLSFLFLSCVILVLSLAFTSYNSWDTSLNTVSQNGCQNILGSFGAYIADVVMQAFGWGSWLIVVFLLSYLCFHYFGYQRRLIWIKRVSAIALMLLFSFLLAKFDKGGFIGALLYLNVPFLSNFIISILWLIWLGLFVFIFDIPFVGFMYFLFKKAQSLYALLLKKEQPVYHKPVKIKKEKKVIPEKKAIKNPVKKVSALDLFKNKNGFVLPGVDLLDEPKAQDKENLTREKMEEKSRLLEEVLAQFKVQGRVVRVSPGPVVTLYEFEPAAGIKTSRVISFCPDVARAMSVVSVRMAVIPGSSVIGVEIPNKTRQMVFIKEIMASNSFVESKGALPLILGKNIGGNPVFADLAKMPHLLVAGTTGSGKSVGINTMILSLLYRFTPEQCRLIMVDPKMLELSVYNGIPHLLTPVVTEPSKAIVALKWTVKEMDDRYRAMATMGVRNIEGYNKKIKETIASGKKLTRQVQTGFDPETGRPIIETQEMDLKPFPYIVVIVDEMADLMLTAGKEVDIAIQRIAQKARASGIHLIMATQRPSVDVITGTIKANFPSRISFQVTTKVDSRTILGEQGAEQLLGRGDMLFMPAGVRPVRLHGPFVSDEEVERVVNFLKTQGEAQYNDAVMVDDDSDVPLDEGAVFDRTAFGSDKSELYDQAVQIVLTDKRPTISYIQRKLSIGYNKAADLIDRMEKEGIVSKASPTGRREILIGDSQQ